MARFIDVEQAKRCTYEEIFWSESEQAAVRHFLAKLPRADAVEVVRCGECRKYVEGHCCRSMCGGSYEPFPMKPSDFCSYGERRAEDG